MLKAALFSKEMLKPKALTQVLGQANTDGVFSALLLNNEGVLMAFSGFDESHACISAAIATSVWNNYEKCGQDIFMDDRLKFSLMVCEGGSVGITRVASYLLCLCARKEVPLGLLKRRLEAMAKYLESPLAMITTP